MKLMQKLICKRGIAIENAILVMLIIFMICTMLTNLALVGHYQVKIENITLMKNVEIDQIGEDYLASIKAGQEFILDSEIYVCSVSDEEYILTVWQESNEPENVVLYVEAELTEEGQVNVIQWRYSLPNE